MKKTSRMIALLLALTLLFALSGCGPSDGKKHLTFQIWDVFQRDAMQAICDRSEEHTSDSSHIH